MSDRPSILGLSLLWKKVIQSISKLLGKTMIHPMKELYLNIYMLSIIQ